MTARVRVFDPMKTIRAQERCDALIRTIAKGGATGAELYDELAKLDEGEIKPFAARLQKRITALLLVPQ